MMKFSLSLFVVILVLGIVSGQGNGNQNHLILGNLNQFIHKGYQQAYGPPNNCLSELWSSECPTDPPPFLIPMSPSLVEYILNLHNYLRSSAASSNKPIPIRWSYELQKLAESSVKQCKVAHDDCLSKTYRSTGQNLALNVYSGTLNARSDAELVLASLQSWWNEYKASRKEKIGWDNRIVVGCAASRYFSIGSHNFLMTCNYATIDNNGHFELLQDNEKTRCAGLRILEKALF